MPGRASPTDVLLCVLAAAPFVIDYSGSLYDSTDFPPRAAAALGCAAAAAWWLRRAARSGETLTLTRWHAALALFLAWCGLSGLWARSGLEWWLAWKHWLLAGAAGALAAAGGGRASPWALAAFFASSVAQAGVALLQYFEVAPFSLILQAVPPSGTLGHRSFAMHWLLLGAPLGGALWVRAARPGALWACGLGLGLIAGVTALASSRAAWVAGAAEAAALAVWAAFEARRGTLPGPPSARWGSAAAGVLLAAGLAASAREDYAARYGGYGERLAAMVGGVAGSAESGPESAAIPANNVRMRLGIWRNSLGLIALRPLRGWGLGNFSIHYPRHSRAAPDGIDDEAYSVGHAHNDAVELFAETGAVGVLLALAVLALAGLCAARLLASSDPWDRAAAAGLGAALGGLLVDSQFCLPAHRALPPFAAAVFMGALAGRAGGRTLRPGKALLDGAGAACALAAVFLLVAAGREAAAQAFYARANGGARALAAHTQPPAGVPPQEWARRRALLMLAVLSEVERAAEFSRDPRIEYTRGSILAQMGRWDEAAAVLKPFLELRPNHFRALVTTALALAASGRGPEALRYAARAVEIEPDSARARNALGLALRDAGRRAEAAEQFARAAALDPAQPDYARREREARALLAPRGQPGPGLR